MNRHEVFDAIVVGSGATGGVAAWSLTARGLRTLVLEAGPDLRRDVYGTPLANLARRLKQRWFTKDQSVQQLHPVYWETNPSLFVSDRDNPYVTPMDAPFRWIRGRQVGGRSHTWGGVCLRFSDHEFNPSGLRPGGRWPVAHADLDPFYARIERLLAVHGSRDGLPQLPDGDFAEPGALSPGERLLQDELKRRFDRDVIIARGIRAGRGTQGGEPHSRLSSNQTSLAAARATGRLTIRSDAVVSRILTNPGTGKAAGVECVDTRSAKRESVFAPLVVLCASALESVRILLNSKSAEFPDGIGGSSGLLGKGIMDHVAGSFFFYLPALEESPGFELLGSEGMLIPRFNHSDTLNPGYGYWGGVSRHRIPRMIRRQPNTALGFLCGMGEAAASDENRIALAPDRTDKWGIACASIHYTRQPEELRLVEKMRADALDMVTAAGGIPVTLADVFRRSWLQSWLRDMDRRLALCAPGLFVHEVGGARMGARESDSVTNPFGQVWDCPNVVIGDGATFVTSGWQNPTLTEMALCLRASEHAADLASAGRL